MLALTPSVQSPRAWDRINLTRAGVRTRLEDAGYRYKIHPLETAAALVDANLVFGFDVGDVRRYGPAIDGATDDTAALTAWLSVGGRLTAPVAGTCKITAALPLMSNSELRLHKNFVIRQYTANANVLSATTKDSITIRGGELYAVGSMSSYFDGQGLHCDGCTAVDVRELRVRNHRGWGVQLYNTADSRVLRCRFLASPVTNADNHTQVAGDVSVAGNSPRNVVRLNHCISGNGIGVSVHSLLATDAADDNSVSGNYIRDCKLYGCEAYNNDPAGTVTGTSFVDNKIKNITGDVAHSVNGYVYGAGIYCVSAQSTVIQANRIKSTHSGAVVFVDTLAPGAIGVTNCGKVTIEANEIDTCGMYGITVRDPAAAGVANQKTIVANNNISAVTQIGIQILEKANVAVHGNEIYSTVSHGIHVANTTTKRTGVRVDGNTVKSAGGTAILIGFTARASIRGNTVETPTVHGIFIADSDDFASVGNVVSDHATYGIGYDDTCTRYTSDANVVRGNGASSYGVAYFALGNLSGTDVASNCATGNFTGNYNPRPAGTPAAGTWVVGNRVYYAVPAAGGNIGAVCTAAGTPGTWKTFGAVAP